MKSVKNNQITLIFDIAFVINTNCYNLNVN